MKMASCQTFSKGLCSDTLGKKLKGQFAENVQ